jgi:hypothetical protein
VKLFLEVIGYDGMKISGEKEVQLHTFLTFALYKDECSNLVSTSSLARLLSTTIPDASGKSGLNGTK